MLFEGVHGGLSTPPAVGMYSLRSDVPVEIGSSPLMQKNSVSCSDAAYFALLSYSPFRTLSRHVLPAPGDGAQYLLRFTGRRGLYTYGDPSGAACPFFFRFRVPL